MNVRGGQKTATSSQSVLGSHRLSITSRATSSSLGSSSLEALLISFLLGEEKKKEKGGKKSQGEEFRPADQIRSVALNQVSVMLGDQGALKLNIFYIPVAAHLIYKV